MSRGLTCFTKCLLTVVRSQTRWHSVHITRDQVSAKVKQPSPFEERQNAYRNPPLRWNFHSYPHCWCPTYSLQSANPQISPAKMELLRPSDLPQPLATGESFLGLPSPSNLPLSFHAASNSHVPETMEECGGKVHVAVGKSVEKAVNLLRWTFTRFNNTEICILHVYQPSSVIPTLCESTPFAYWYDWI